MPENTLLSFYTGISMNANGIETDVQRTKDGVLVLFHDDTITRVTGEEGSVSDYTLEELQAFDVKKDGFVDKIVTFEDFLSHFAFRDITFAIELKVGDIEEDVAKMLRRFDMSAKCVITSFHLDYIRKFKKYAPEFRVGYLTREVTDEIINNLIDISADEICPKARELTADNVDKWHKMGFRVRAWGVADEEVMRHAFDVGVDGMTVNFPDKLNEYIISKNS